MWTETVLLGTQEASNDEASGLSNQMAERTGVFIHQSPCYCLRVAEDGSRIPENVLPA